MTTTINPTVTLEQAESYFAMRLRSTVWNEASEDDKNKALAQASSLVSAAFILDDSAHGVREDGTIIWNDRIIAAICEESIWLLGHDPSEIPESLFKGISQAAAGSVSATFDKSFVCPWICHAAVLLVGDLGVYLGDDDGSVKTTLLAM